MQDIATAYITETASWFLLVHLVRGVWFKYGNRNWNQNQILSNKNGF